MHWDCKRSGRRFRSLKADCTDFTYNCIAVSSEDNPSFLSGQPTHGGVALFWKTCFNDLVKPLENIDSDRIGGIRCDFNEKSPFLFSVYICPLRAIVSKNLMNTVTISGHYTINALSAECFVIIMGDLNGDLGNSLGDKGCYAPNDRGLRLLDFANYFNLCPINLLSICSGPLETFVSHCGRFKSTIDYILLLNCPHDSIVSCKTFEQTIENTSDHFPIQLKINFYDNSCTALSSDNCSEMAAKSVKVRWSNYSTETISTLYATSIANKLENMSSDDYNRLADSAVLIKDFLLKHSAPLVKPTRKNKNCGKAFIKLPEDVKKARSRGNIAFNSWKLLNYPVEGDIHETYHASRKEYRKKLRIFLNQCEADKITKLCDAAESNEKLFWKLIKSQRFSSKMIAFVVNGEVLTDKNKIRDMWADHFEALGSPSEIETFDKDFFNKVSDSVRESLFFLFN